jgi:hypothetical protein
LQYRLTGAIADFIFLSFTVASYQRHYSFSTNPEPKGTLNPTYLLAAATQRTFYFLVRLPLFYTPIKDQTTRGVADALILIKIAN